MNPIRPNPPIHLSYTDNDFLIGNRRLCRENGGNRLVRHLAAQRFEEHELADVSTDYMDVGLKTDKLDIKKEIVLTIKRRGGRFLKNVDGNWTVVSDKIAQQKVADEFKRIRRNGRGRSRRRRTIASVANSQQPQPIQGDQNHVNAGPGVALTPRLPGGVYQPTALTQQEVPAAVRPDLKPPPPRTQLRAEPGVVRTCAQFPGQDFFQPSSPPPIHPADAQPTVPPADLKTPPVAQPPVAQLELKQPAVTQIGAYIVGSRAPFVSTLSDQTPSETRREQRPRKHARSDPVVVGGGDLPSRSAPTRGNQAVADRGRISTSAVTPAEIAMPNFRYNHSLPTGSKSDLESAGSPFSVSVHSGSDMSWSAKAEDVLERSMSGLSMSEPSSVGNSSGSSGIAWSSSSNRNNKSTMSSSINQNKSSSAGPSLGRISETETDSVKLKRNIKSSVKQINAKFGDESFVADSLETLAKCSDDIEKEGQAGTFSGFDLLPCIKILVDAARRYPENLSIQRDCFWALGSLAKNEDNRVLISEEGGVKLLLKSMAERKSSSSDLLVNCCRALANLSCNNLIAAGAIKMGGVVLVVQSMDQYERNHRLQRYGCFTLAALAVHSSSHKLFAENNRIGWLVRSMKLFQGDEEVQSKCCLALARLASDGRIQSLVGRAGGVEPVVKAMKTFSLNEQLQQNGCAALANLSIQHSNIVAIAKEGGLRCIANAMAVSPYNEELQEGGCVALHQIVVNFANAPEIDRSVGIGVVAKAMTAFPLNSELQERGCLVLAALAREKRYQPALVDYDALAPLLRSLKGCSSSNNEVQESGGFAVIALLMNDHTVSEVVDKDGIEVLVNSMRNLSDNDRIQEIGCRVLSDLALRGNGSEALRKVRAVSLLLKSMMDHPRNRKIQENVSLALSRLSMRRHDHDVIVAGGGISLLIRALENFPSNDALHRYACCALGNLAENNEKNARLIGAMDTMKMLIEATNKFETNEKVLGDICFALEALVSASEENRQTFFSMRANKLAERVWGKLSPSAKVRLREDICDIRDRIVFP